MCIKKKGKKKGGGEGGGGLKVHTQQEHNLFLGHKLQDQSFQIQDT